MSRTHDLKAEKEILFLILHYTDKIAVEVKVWLIEMYLSFPTIHQINLML